MIPTRTSLQRLPSRGILELGSAGWFLTEFLLVKQTADPVEEHERDGRQDTSEEFLMEPYEGFDGLQ